MLTLWKTTKTIAPYSRGFIVQHTEDIQGGLRICWLRTDLHTRVFGHRRARPRTRGARLQAVAPTQALLLGHYPRMSLSSKATTKELLRHRQVQGDV